MRKDAFVLTLLIVAALVLSACQPAMQVEDNSSPAMMEKNDSMMTGDESGADDGAMMDEKDSDNMMTGDAVIDVELPLTGVVINATEGDLVQLRPEAIDPDNDVVTYFFTPPFDSKGKWQTMEGDAGKVTVTVTASDGKANTTEDVTVIIFRAKKGPVVECPESVTVKEGDEIVLNCNIYDPEGDQAIIEYSGFMKGPTYQTSFEDAGDYTTIVKARNKYKETVKTVKITVLNTNRAPTVSFDFGDTIGGTEGDIITLNADAKDPDGDKVTVTYSEPFDSTGAWKTKIGDAGSHPVSVVVSDGKLTSKKDITVEIAMKNTAPVLKNIPDITVYEGETIKVPVDVYDREGDNVKVTVKGWLSSLTYATSYEDAGVYTATVIASDGQYEASQTFKVTVIDRNRPPVFKVPA